MKCVAVVIVDILTALLCGLVLNAICFIRSLYAYHIVPRDLTEVLAVALYAIVGIYVWKSRNYRLQPLLKFLVLLFGVHIGLVVVAKLNILVRVCDAYHVEAENLAQGLIGVSGIIRILLVGVAVVFTRIFMMDYKTKKNCYRFFEYGRFQLLNSSGCETELYDAEEKKVILTNVLFYKHKRRVYYFFSKSKMVVVITPKRGVLSLPVSQNAIPEEHMEIRLIESVEHSKKMSR